MRLRLLAFVFAAAACEKPAPRADTRPPESTPAVADSAQPAPSAPAAETIDSLAAIVASSGGSVGMVAVHVESGRRVEHLPAESFPMASTYKLPIVLAILAKVDSGRISLDDSVDVMPSDFRIGPSQIADSVGAAGGKATVGAMIRSVMMYSDNTSSDRLMRLAGGAEAVTAHVRARGVQDMRIDRYEGEVHWQYNGVSDVPPPDQWSVAEFNRRIAAVPAAEKEAAHARFWNDPRDTSTPAAMAALLVQVQRRDGLSATSQRVLLDAMERSPTGRGRIRALLPAGTTVADKTGTIGRTTNDVGIITLPDGSHLALAVLVKMSTRSNADEERTIARVARAVYDHFAR
ncbi:MAG: Beta-lactamase [uncultured Gemmatimonadetes bacterium]|uniref:Beta-lactamase n=1 Tax=uncultured Gemmatimonadota bacterium TaxID=203437 RepID=A0A6J4MKR4_9BACT|nr:MAG: Beta-lactamase [uncultured Gemmatimonadota bacterium]